MIPGAIRFDFNVVKPDERTSQGDLWHSKIPVPNAVIKIICKCDG
jgi:hypothetical protein